MAKRPCSWESPDFPAWACCLSCGLENYDVADFGCPFDEIDEES